MCYTKIKGNIMRFLILILLYLTPNIIAQEYCAECRVVLPTKKKKNTITKKDIIKYRENKPECSINSFLWVELIVEDEVDIYQLALRYYGDMEEYKRIYLANRDIIGKDLKIVDGMILKIPIMELFEEQPMILNRD